MIARAVPDLTGRRYERGLIKVGIPACSHIGKRECLAEWRIGYRRRSVVDVELNSACHLFMSYKTID